MGHKVIGVDVSRAKVEMMDSGRTPIIEARMSEMVAEAHRAGLLRATSDATAAVLNSEVSFVCVGTPSLKNGKLDLCHIESVAREIGAAIRQKKSAARFCSAQHGAGRNHRDRRAPHSRKRKRQEVRPGFHRLLITRSSCAKAARSPTSSTRPTRFSEPSDTNHLAPLRELYKNTPGTLYETTIPVAEMVKYFSNCYHAVKVGFANEMGTMCKHLGVDAQAVTNIFTSDTKLNISAAYLSPGFAFGGSCLPKDLRAITYKAKELDLKLPLLESLMPSNVEHVDRAMEMVMSTGKKKIAQLGLSFKAGTDDLRESPQVQLIKRLMGEGLEVKVWDEDVSLGRLAGANRQYIEEVIPHIGSVLSADLEATLRSAEVVILGNKSASKDQLAKYLRPEQIVIDLIHLDKTQRPEGAGTYEGICW